LIGRLFRPSTVSGLLLTRTLYSRAPILAVPVGRIRFCALIAFTTSLGASPVALSARGSRSTMICRGLPPKGRLTEAPCTVASCVRTKFCA
jgi:hypothetical protein